MTSQASLESEKSKRRRSTTKTSKFYKSKKAKNIPNVNFKRGSLLLKEKDFEDDSDVNSSDSESIVSGNIFDLKINLKENEIEGLNKAFWGYMDPDTKKIDFFKLFSTLEEKDI